MRFLVFALLLAAPFFAWATDLGSTENVPMWAFMGLLALFQLFLGMMFMRVWKAVDGNTEASAKLAVELPTNYATKEDFKEYRKRVHDLGDELHAHELRPHPARQA